MNHLLPAHPGHSATERLCHPGLAREAAAPASGTPRGGGNSRADRLLRPVSDGRRPTPHPHRRTPSPAFHPSAPIPRPAHGLPVASATRTLSPPSGSRGRGLGLGRAGDRSQAGRGGSRPEGEGKTRARREPHPYSRGRPGAGRPPGRDASPRRAGAGVARGRPRGGTSSQWRW